jgi:pimeloyl-ACP methyl ester carboxylesterase
VTARAGPRAAQVLHLADGRALGYAEWGDPGGRAVLELHGNPGGRLLLWDEDLLTAAGTRWITVDRPGIGLSDPRPARRVTDWADDVAELTDALGLGRFAVVGFSVGGAYAAGCAHRLGERVSAVALVSSIVPFDRPGSFEALGRSGYWRLSRRAPGLAALSLRLQTAIARAMPSIAARAFARGLSDADAELVRRRPEVVTRGIEQASDAMQRGARGLIEDLRIVMGPWGFGLDEIEVPTAVWQGDDDGSIPASWGERLATEIPGARLRARPGEGHLLIADRLGDIVAELERMGGAGLEPATSSV